VGLLIAYVGVIRAGRENDSCRRIEVHGPSITRARVVRAFSPSSPILNNRRVVLRECLAPEPADGTMEDAAFHPRQGGPHEKYREEKEMIAVGERYVCGPRFCTMGPSD